MEFLESLSLLHLQQRLGVSNSSMHQKTPKYVTNYEGYNSKFGGNQQEYFQSDHELNEYIQTSGQEIRDATHFSNVPSLSFSSVTAFNKSTAGRMTQWNFITEQPFVAGLQSTFPTVTTTESVVIDEYPLRLPTWGIVILIVGYLLVFVFGVIGNCCVMFVVLRLRRMKTVTNYFILSLSASDMLILLFCLLPNLVNNIFVPWVLGWFLCKIVPYIQGLSVCSSVYFLVAISVERCISIQWPFKYHITKEKAKIIIIAIWLWSGIVALPWALYFQSGAFDPENPHLQFCIEVWPKEYKHWSTYYFLFGNLLICYILPLGIILICYSTIWYRVYRRSVPSNCYQKTMEYIHQRSKTAVIKMLIVVVLIFALSWLPLYAIIVRIKFGKTPSDTESYVISLVYPVAQWLGSFNSCINPIIYSFLNIKFRRAFLSIIRSDRKRNIIKYKHKSPTVNILLQRLSTIQHRVETTMSSKHDSSESM